MAARGEQIHQMDIVHYHQGLGLQGIEDQPVERFLERQRMVFGGCLDEVSHVEIRSAQTIVGRTELPQRYDTEPIAFFTAAMTWRWTERGFPGMRAPAAAG